jgi:beta-1,4-mannosyl-glycoprotein beta-1,4-N-acetylglucosaminyltransferase
MKVFDCCCFLNENDLYEIRLNEHWDFVDKFIIVEVGETHTGLKKSLNFDHARFEKYKEKIHYVSFDNFEEEMAKHPGLLDYDAIVDRGPNTVTMDWTRGHFQANYFNVVLEQLGAENHDIVYVSCLDEIIKKKAFEESLTRFENKTELFQNGLRPVFGFHYYLYAYKFNLLHMHCDQHVAGMITEYYNLKILQPSTFRSRSISTHPHIKNAGWHFTFLDCTDGEMVLEKQRSWSHSRDRYPGQKLKFDNVTKEEALERFFHDYPVTIVPITPETHPKYIIDNLDKMQNFIYKNV